MAKNATDRLNEWRDHQAQNRARIGSLAYEIRTAAQVFDLPGVSRLASELIDACAQYGRSTGPIAEWEAIVKEETDEGGNSMSVQAEGDMERATADIWTTYDFYDTRHLHGAGNIGRIFVQPGRVPYGGDVRVISYHASRDAAVDDAVSRLRNYVSNGHVAQLTVGDTSP